MITSHETEVDYTNFFKALLDITNNLGIRLNPVYIMIDASKSMANAIKLCFPNCIICMCYFHLTYNVSLLNFLY